ncbi:MAG: Hsp20/alpha crystallin family protein [Gammaproteobacteria bacterium]|nr:Hsp20/alpha crystallin family protein [Gammaproteobacteria bacterium]
MISNMLRFPLSMFDDDLDNWFFPEARRFNRRPRSAYPPVNIGVTDENVDVYLFIPGMDPAALDVVIEKKLLSISGERQLKKQASEDAQVRTERFDGAFKRVITLPEDVDVDTVEAQYQDGVLHIRLAKPALSQPRQIKVSAQ